jgi:hypothetical protein
MFLMMRTVGQLDSETDPEHLNIRRPLRFSPCLYNSVHPIVDSDILSSKISLTYSQTCYHQTLAQPTTPAPTRYLAPTHTPLQFLKLTTIMSPTKKTLAGPASKPSAKRAGTTSTNIGGKRKRPVSASENADKGGVPWTIGEVSDTSSIMSFVETDHLCRNVSCGGSACALMHQPWPTKTLAQCSVAPPKHAGLLR